MSRVIFITHNGSRHELEVEANSGKNLMQIALDLGVPGILGDCGGCCSCATCHAYVGQDWLDKMPPRSPTEQFMLNVVDDVQDNSRLCCQIRMTEALDGITLTVPAEQY